VRKLSKIIYENIAYYFYKKYKYPKLKFSQYNYRERKFDEISTINRDDVFEEIIDKLADNKIFILKGNVGNGKSTFLRKLYFDLDDTFQEYKYLPIYINILDQDIDTSSEEKLYSSILEKIIKFLRISKISIMEDNRKIKKSSNTVEINANGSSGVNLFQLFKLIIKQSHSISDTNISENNTTKQSIYQIERPLDIIQSFADDLYDRNKTEIILLIDNLDTLNYDNERYMFFDDENGFGKFKNKTTIAKKFIYNMIQQLNGSKVKLFFSMRPYVYSHFNFSQQDQNGEFLREMVEYEILGNYSGEAIELRAEILKEVCDDEKLKLVYNKKRKYSNILELYKSFDSLYKDIFRKKDSKYTKTIEEFFNICNQGHRTITMFYHDVKFHPDFYKDLFTHNAIQLYKLDFKKSYTQIIPKKYHQDRLNTHSGKKYSYPNIFVTINGIECNNDVREACMPTSFTYWLKYLILLYVSNQKSITVENIIKTFHNDQNGYDLEAVKLVIGSLGTINEYNCLYYDFGGEEILTCDDLISKTYVTPTRFGKYLIESEISFSLLDLQFFVEDWLLLKPYYKKIFKEKNDIEFFKNSIDRNHLNLNEKKDTDKNKKIFYPLSYNYLLSGEEQFRKMMKFKAKQSILFLFYLESSFKYEQEKYKEIWKKVESSCINNKRIFRENFFSDKRKKVIDELYELFKDHTNKDSDKDELENFLKTCSNYQDNITQIAS
jgi:hypothetical protein